MTSDDGTSGAASREPDAIDRIERALGALRRAVRPGWSRGSGDDDARGGGGRGRGGHGGHGRSHGGPWSVGLELGPDGRPIAGPPWGGGWHGGPHDHDGPSAHGGRSGHGGLSGHGRGWDGRFGQIARYRVLAALETSEHPLSVTDVANIIGVDQPRASRLIQAAVDEGHVVREADPSDARRTRARLTDEGMRAIRATRSGRRQTIEAALAAFSPDERAQFADLLTRFAQGLHGDIR